MSDMFDVTDKSIVITGASGVLCGSIASELAERGARLCLVDYNVRRAYELCQQFQDRGAIAVAVEANVLEKDQLKDAYNCAVETLGGVDILINGAGGNKKEATTSDEHSFFDMPPQALRDVFDLNFLGTLLPCQVFGEYMANNGAGTILNVSSMSASQPLTKIAGYSAAKAAIDNFTKWLSVHMCQNYSHDIRVNAIAPGFFLTDQNRFLLTDENTGELTDRGKTIIDHTPMGRFGDPEDLLGTVLWLLSDASKFVNGTVIPIDGGFSAFSGV